jgi:hypothetical protein
MSRARRIRNALLLAYAIWFGAFLLIVAISAALAHNAPSGWSYDPACCSDRDCAPVPARFIRATPAGLEISIPAGAHPFVAGEALREVVPYADPRIRPSGDGQHHACVSPSRRLLCIYLPVGGV